MLLLPLLLLLLLLPQLQLLLLPLRLLRLLLLLLLLLLWSLLLLQHARCATYSRGYCGPIKGGWLVGTYPRASTPAHPSGNH